MRSYNVTPGSISIDGQALQEVRKTSFLPYISTVPQNVGVFNTSILENLRYAKFDATLDECEEACHAVGLHGKFTSSLPKATLRSLGRGAVNSLEVSSSDWQLLGSCFGTQQ